MIPRLVLVLVLLSSAVASCFASGFFLVFTEEGLRKHGAARWSLIGWLCIPLVPAMYLSIPVALMVVFNSDPLRHAIAIVLLSVPPVLIPLVTLLTIIRYGGEEIAGYPAAYGGRPPRRLSTIGALILMEGLYLLAPASAWVLSLV